MNAGLLARFQAAPARRLFPLAVLFLAAGFAFAGCGNDEEAQRAADSRAYRAEPATPAATPVEARTGSDDAPGAATDTPVESADPGSAATESSRPETGRAGSTPDTPQPVDYAEAESLYHQGRYNEAADAFVAYTTRRPQNPWGHYMLGLSHWKAGRAPEAEEALGRALELDPELTKARLNLARVLLDEGRPAVALPEAREVTERVPESGEAYRVLGRAFHNLNRNEEAVDAYLTAIRRDPRDVWAMNNLGLIYIQQERFADALPPLARAVSLRDDLAVIQNNLGVALERTGRFAAAGEAYRAALVADPAHGRASESLARIAGIPDESGFGENGLADLAARFVESLERPRGEGTGDETAAVEGSPSP